MVGAQRPHATLLITPVIIYVKAAIPARPESRIGLDAGSVNPNPDPGPA